MNNKPIPNDTYRNILKLVESGPDALPEMPTSTRYKFLRMWSGAELRGDQLFVGDQRVVSKGQVESVLQEIYDKAQFGRDKLFKTYIDGHYLGISRAAVSDFLARNETQQLHQPVPRKLNIVKSVIAREPLHTWMIDTTLLSETAAQRRFLIVMLDCHSKYAYAKLVDKNKRARNNAGLKGISAKDILVFLRGMITPQYKPKILESDNGVEFKNETIKQFLSELGIRQMFGSTYASRSQGQVERLNKTLKGMIFKQFTHLENAQFNNVKLQEIVALYNGSYHSTIQKKPEEAHKFELDEANPAGVTEVATKIVQQADKLALKYRNTQSVIDVGDQVRVSLEALDRRMIKQAEKGFTKAYRQQWSAEVFTVVKKSKPKQVNRVAPFYMLKDSEGAEVPSRFYRNCN